MSGSTDNAKATLFQRVALFFLRPVFPWIAALLATLSVATTLDVADEANWSLNGPGLTFDECFNIEVGVYLVDAFLNAELAALHPATLQEIYSHEQYNPDHPPLGRIALGVTRKIAINFSSEDLADQYFVSGARLASAAEYGLLILLLGIFSRRWFGAQVSCLTTLSVIFMPRLFGHAHLASLETCTCLTYSMLVLFLADQWSSKSQPSVRKAFFPGVLLGLVLLTKIHGVLLFPVLIVWGLWNWKLKSILPMITTFVVAFAVFFVGWPWLWIDPFEHLREYFGSATQRASLNCFYLGQKYADKEVPWHYPFVMFVVTMPLGFMLSGLWALINRTDDENSKQTVFDQRTQLVFGAFLIPIVTFAIPGVTIYDGVRLFLMSFPLFAIFAGLGMKRIFESLQRRNGNKIATVFLITCFAGPAYNMVNLHPCHLSYYSETVGGLWKAEELGFETSYWGDSVTPALLEESLKEIPDGSKIEVAPVLHPLQTQFMEKASWFKNRPDIVLSPYDDARRDLSRYVLVIRRRADPWNSLSPPPRGTQTFGKVSQQGVTLSEFYLLPKRLNEADMTRQDRPKTEKPR